MQIKNVTSAPSAPGIYSGLSNAAYHAGPGVSKSGLDLLARSPLHYWARHMAPFPEERIETPAMRFGTAVHTAILEPDAFAKWVVMPRVDGRTKEGKAAKAAAEELAQLNQTPIISAEDHDKVRALAETVSLSPIGRYFSAPGHAELSVYWNDPDTGILCRCRPDWLSPPITLDLKTTEDASPAAFTRSAYGWRYFVQAAFYMDGLEANGIYVDEFIFAAVEKAPPFASMGFRASQRLINAGREEYRRLLRLLYKCHNEGDWPGYGDGIIDLDLPTYARELSTLFDNAIAASDDLV